MRVRPPAPGGLRATPNAQRIVAALLGVLVVGVPSARFSGWWAGGRAAPPPASRRPTRRARRAPARCALEVASDWVPVPRVPGVSGLPAATAAFTPAASLRAYAIVTMSPIDDPSLLPQALRRPDAREAPRRRRRPSCWACPPGATASCRCPTGACSRSRSCPRRWGRWRWPASRRASPGWPRSAARRHPPGHAAQDASWLPPAADVAAARRRSRARCARLDGRRVGLRAKLQAAKTRGGQSRFAGRLGGGVRGRRRSRSRASTPASGPRRRVARRPAPHRGRLREARQRRRRGRAAAVQARRRRRRRPARRSSRPRLAALRRAAARPRPAYSARRPASARPSVTSSAYSRSPPTGRPEASRVTATSGARSWSAARDVQRGRLAGGRRVGGDHDLAHRRVGVAMRA